jgi:hypothetical protein
MDQMKRYVEISCSKPKGDAAMMKTFHPCCLGLAGILSVMLVLSVTQLTQAKTSHFTQYYPSQTQAEDAISYYYTHISIFHEKNTILHFNRLIYRPVYSVRKPMYSNPEEQKKFDGFAGWWRFDICADYQFAPLTSPQARQTAHHLFTFEILTTDPDTWHVIGMSLQSC